VHRLPRQLGWGLGLLAFVCGAAVDWQRAPEDTAAILVHAFLWFGLCAIFAAVAGYLICIALGTQSPPKPEETLVALPALEGAGRATGRNGSLVDLASGAEPLLPPMGAGGEEEFEPYAPEEVAQAIRSQLGADEVRAR
jgi:hypothetical protein